MGTLLFGQACVVFGHFESAFLQIGIQSINIFSCSGINDSGNKLQSSLLGKPVVGVFLPNSVGHLVTLLSLFRIGKTPAILNFSLGIRSLLDCCETAQIDTILTSRVFIEKGKLEHIIAGLEPHLKIIYNDRTRTLEWHWLKS